MGSTFLHFVCIFAFLLCHRVSEIVGENRFGPNLNFQYQNRQNACTRKLLCLIASKNDGRSYENIRKGLDYFYGGFNDREPFRSELEFLHSAWNAGSQISGNVDNVCSNLNITNSCTMSSDKLLQTFSEVYNENEFSIEDNEVLSRRTRALTGMGKRLMKMLRRIKFLGRPFLRPDEAKDRAVCQRCEDKRTQCFNYYMGTYGLCGGAWLVAGVIGTASCNIITIPRTIDCTINAWFNCHQKNCGFVGF